MDLSSQLMNQIRMQNEPQAQLIQQANQEADLLQHMPTQNPMGPAMMKFGLGILGAPPEMSTSQAMGLSGQEAMKTYEEHSQKQNQNRMQSIALRQTAANTIDAVRKFNMENEFKNRQMVNLEAQTTETKRHNQMSELLKAAENGQNNPRTKAASEHINTLYKKGLNNKDSIEHIKGLLGASFKSSGNFGFDNFGVGKDVSLINQFNNLLPTEYKAATGNSTAQNVRNATLPAIQYFTDQVVSKSIDRLRKIGKSDEEIESILDQNAQEIREEALKEFNVLNNEVRSSLKLPVKKEKGNE